MSRIKGFKELNSPDISKVFVKSHKRFKTVRTSKTLLKNVNKAIVQLRKGYGLAVLVQLRVRPRFDSI